MILELRTFAIDTRQNISCNNFSRLLPLFYTQKFHEPTSYFFFVFLAPIGAPTYFFQFVSRPGIETTIFRFRCNRLVSNDPSLWPTWPFSHPLKWMTEWFFTDPIAQDDRANTHYYLKLRLSQVTYKKQSVKHIYRVMTHIQ